MSSTSFHAAGDQVPQEAKASLLALWVLTERLRSLPKSALANVHELIGALKDEVDDEDYKEILLTMEEILIQAPIATHDVPLD